MKQSDNFFHQKLLQNHEAHHLHRPTKIKFLFSFAKRPSQTKDIRVLELLIENEQYIRAAAKNIQRMLSGKSSTAKHTSELFHNS